MPTTKTIELFQYNELSPTAKEVARQWWLSSLDSSDYEATTDDFVGCAAILGVEVAQRMERTMGGGQRPFPDVRWSLSYSQGDGASYVGEYAYRKGAVTAIKQHTGGTDEELIRIATDLQALQAKWQYGLRARMNDGAGSNHYSHSGTMAVDVEFLDTRGNERNIPDGKAGEARAAEEELTRLMRDLADWFYARLRDEDEHLSSEEQVAETMEANEYTFRADGRRED